MMGFWKEFFCFHVYESLECSLDLGKDVRLVDDGRVFKRGGTLVFDELSCVRCGYKRVENVRVRYGSGYRDVERLLLDSDVIVSPKEYAEAEYYFKDFVEPISGKELLYRLAGLSGTLFGVNLLRNEFMSGLYLLGLIGWTMGLHLFGRASVIEYERENRIVEEEAS